MPREQNRNRYFQEIARVFLQLRGAPFVLSSRDIDAISRWEEKGIPLRVVLEGIERAFEKYRTRGAAGRKIPSLSYCEREILSVHAEHREIAVGRAGKSDSREDKRRRIRQEVNSFLKRLTPETSFLGEVYREALAVLSRKGASEDDLERLDAKAEELIFAWANAETRERVEKQVRSDFPGRPGAELQEIAAREIIKKWREKYRVPYLSYFYY